MRSFLRFFFAISNFNFLNFRKKWNLERYPEHGKDIGQPGLMLDEAAKYAHFVFLWENLTAGDAQRPAWNKGGFVEERHGKKKRYLANRISHHRLALYTWKKAASVAVAFKSYFSGSNCFCLWRKTR